MFTGIVQELGLIRSVKPSKLPVEIAGAFVADLSIGKDRRHGHPVNLEFDILAKHVERMIRFVYSD